MLAAFRLLDVYPWNHPGFDLHAYWATRSGFGYGAAHAGPWGQYLYSPAFAQAIAPLTALPYPAFAAIWTMLGAAVLVWLVGRRALVLGILPPVLVTIAQGQMDLAFAAVIVLGLRWPAAWAVPILTKVTPGIGVVWFLVRREWRSLAIALGATIAVIAVSALFDANLWRDWFAMLARQDFPEPDGNLIFLPVSFWARVPIALAIITWGALTDRRWTIPIAVCLAMPIVWFNSPTILLAMLPLALDADSPAGRWLRADPRRSSSSARPD